MTRPHPSSLASALRAFLTDYLPRQRPLSPHTLHSYRDSLKLLLQFVAGKKANPGRLTMEHLTYERVMAFLLHLETGRNNQVRENYQSALGIACDAGCPNARGCSSASPLIRLEWPGGTAVQRVVCTR